MYNNAISGGAGWGLYLHDDVVVDRVTLGPNTLTGNAKGEVRDAEALTKTAATLAAERPLAAFDAIVPSGRALPSAGRRVMLLPGVHAFLAGMTLSERVSLTRPA